MVIVDWIGLVGAAGLSAPAGTAANADLGPVTCDSFTIWYMRRATTGTFDISVDGGTATTIGGSGADGLQSATISAGSLGSHTLHMGSVSGGIAVIIGVEATVGTGGIYVSNGGLPSSGTSSWMTASGENPWNGEHTAGDTPQPKLTVIGLGVNDDQANTNPATTQSKLDTILAKALTYGSALLWIEPQRTDVSSPTYPWTQYVDAIKAAGAARSVPVLDIGALWGGTITAYDSGDHVHPSTEGHYQIARAIHRAITSF